MMKFNKAKRSLVVLKTALTGPSGSGKTLSSLKMAKALGKKIALIDTENASASLYADRFEFDTLVISPPYTIPKYIEAIETAIAAKYDVLIIDSLSHAWAGEGGLLAKKEALDQRGGNSFANWAGITKEHERLKAIILNCPIHLIVTMRSKQDYVLETNERGKQAPKKIGLAPVQREGMEYEFTTVFDLAMDHNAVVSKDRTGLFDGQIFKIDETTGEKLIKWLKAADSDGFEAKPEAPAAMAPASSSVPDKIAEPKTSGVKCPECQAELRLHRTGAGYLCPNSRTRDDKHLRFGISELKTYQEKANSITVEGN